MRYYLASFVLISTLLAATPVVAETLVRTSSQYELPKGQIIEGNFLGVGNPVSISGEVKGDAVLLGNRVTVTGLVGEDVLAFGVLSTIDGVVQDDVRVVSGNTTISGAVAGDLLAVGGAVDVLSDAVIEGDLLVYGGSANISGRVGGDVIGSVRDMTIDGPVGGAVDVRVMHLTLGQYASVTESVRYTSNDLLTQNINTIVGGSVLRNDPIMAAQGITLRSIAMPFILLLFTSWLWLFLSRKTLNAVVVQTVSHLPRSAVTGLIAALVFPLIMFVLFLSVLGSYVALIGLVSYVLLLLLASAALPAVIGYLCMRASNLKGSALTAVTVLIGSVVCTVLLLLPSIGMISLVFLSVVVFGGVIETVIKGSR